MRILVTNDDGIYSPGINALAEIAREFGEVKVVAPDVEQSSMGHAVTHSRPLSVKKSPIEFKTVEAYRVNGTPADCVAMGTHLWNHVDVVLSGINMGPNLGNSMWHSGTLAAARQAVLFGIKGIAMSTPVGKTEPDFKALAPYVKKTLEMLLHTNELALYNVNFPSNPIDIMWTKQSVRLYDGRIVPGQDPMARKHYWFTVIPLEAAEPGTDRWAVENNFVSITPLRLDLTDEKTLKEKQKSDVNHTS
ncbi:5'-nucleotidase; exopolyphosphatase; 3'-nucleotidase [Pseudopedobacter saltans DSM 12145]|uniref:5'-nucleotidase SurE n=1 Tax=Pseudopedobacter saltans (strain ATCC 51119 / DSM 12145 / JCM 21818 / CCUG 39354 / LMG 10337 / NBRC 100064 / NCIMB 13643) TaxID=762903 RepID=F0S5M0_PSESL|nr:5'/3'-nucleotidase SurE [Pseudopedobacter saltans]ADY54194.1 5'-nucleotidase; exopolyphosphatase; 3'-nucleotidase [Pseudopedobacter saltans DSM 12145]